MMKKALLAVALLALPAIGLLGQTYEFRPPLRVPAAGGHAKLDSLHGFDVQSYTLRISLPMTNDSLRGQQRVTAIVRQAGLDTLALSCAGIAVDSVTQDGAVRGWRLAGDTLYAGIAPAAAGDHVALDIFYALGGRGSNRRGYYWYSQGGQALYPVSYTMSAPQDARYWMPCFDEPWDKADSGCAFYVTVPLGFAVAANGLLLDTMVTAGTVTWHWREDHAIATYLMALHASNYAFWTDTARTAAGDTVPLDYFVWPQDSALSRAVFDLVPAMLECFSRKLGRYPFAKYGMATVAPFMFGGMENQTMTTIIRDWLASDNQYGIAHELSHMWFGDLVTCGTWADIWLNEGFASYCEALYDEQRNPGAKPGTYMMGTFQSALSGNANTYPIYNEPMALIYDVSMEYAKGAWVLQNLRWVMGDSAFFAGLHAYCDSFAYGNAVTSEFQRIMEHQYHQPLGWFFDEWVHRAGHPAYATVAYYRTHPDSLAALVKIRQTSTTGDLYTMPLALACSTAAGRQDTVIWVSDTLSGPFTMRSAQPLRLVALDPDNWVLKEWIDSRPRLRAVLPGVLRLTPVWYRYADDPVPPSGYNIYRSLSGAGPFLRVNAAVCTDTTYVDTALTAGIRYYYAVTAVSGSDTCYETKFSNVASRVPTGVAGGPDQGPGPGTAALENNRPNPFARGTVIGFQLAEPGIVSLKVYNAAGQLVKTLVDGERAAGRHAVTWNASDERGHRVATGTYFYRLRAGGKVMSRGLCIIK